MATHYEKILTMWDLYSLIRGATRYSQSLSLENIGFDCKLQDGYLDDVEKEDNWFVIYIDNNKARTFIEFHTDFEVEGKDIMVRTYYSSGNKIFYSLKLKSDGRFDTITTYWSEGSENKPLYSVKSIHEIIEKVLYSHREKV